MLILGYVGGKNIKTLSYEETIQKQSPIDQQSKVHYNKLIMAPGNGTVYGQKITNENIYLGLSGELISTIYFRARRGLFNDMYSLDKDEALYEDLLILIKESEQYLEINDLEEMSTKADDTWVRLVANPLLKNDEEVNEIVEDILLLED